jgi:hypothetical protein
MKALEAHFERMSEADPIEFLKRIDPGPDAPTPSFADPLLQQTAELWRSMQRPPWLDV